MHGNVWELTEDCYVDEHDAERAESLTETPPECSTRVLRGGSWLDLPRYDRPSTYRLDLTPANRGDNHGFRVARTL
jgi:formylglycine-generating enzyme required for sulfatase activity